MELKTSPVDRIKAWIPESRMPIADDQLLCSSWRAMPIVREKIVSVTVMPSARHIGFVHYEVLSFGGGESFTSKNPVYPSHVADFLNHPLAPYGLRAEELVWRECDQGAPDKPMPEPAAAQEFVYFLAAGPFVKIGKSTGSPAARIKDLQTGCPYRISLLAHVVGGISEEFSLHKRFAAYRAHGEWFRHEGELKEHISLITGVGQ